MRALLWIAGLVFIAAPSVAQQPEGIVLIARRISPTIPFKIYNPAGSLRIIGWNHDSVVIRGRVRPPDFYFNASQYAMKGGVDPAKGGVDPAMIGVKDPGAGESPTPYHLVIYVPERAQLSVKTASADIDGNNISGWFWSASGTIQLRGVSSTLDVESINGSIDIDATAPWIHARTGPGRLLIRGAIQDVDASTIDGALDVASPSILRGRFSSVTGDIRYAGAPAAGGIFEFSNHTGAVDFFLPRNVSSVFELSSVTGPIENGFTQVQPVSAGPHSLRLRLGRGDAQVTVRTFKGPIRLRPQQP